ncbi:MAG: ChaN family lipoprotein [Myxococcota bacterium]
MRSMAMVVALLAGCTPKQAPVAAGAEAQAPPAPMGGPWATSVLADHPLVGRIWDVAGGRFVDVDAMVADLRSADHVLLGEKHDNPDHHRLQALLVRELAPPAVGFEMLDVGDPIADATTADALAEASDWANSGWPPFDFYRPIFDAAYGGGAKVIAAHPTREEVDVAMQQGASALPAEATAGLPDRPLPAEALASLSEEIVESHCGHAPDEVVQMMIRGQELKDAWMARALQQAGEHSVLVAGGGHTRVDRGVPFYLDGKTETVQMVEVSRDEPDPASYDEPATYVWFTPRVDEDDPCEKFRQQLEAMRHAHAEDAEGDDDGDEEGEGADEDEDADD